MTTLRPVVERDTIHTREGALLATSPLTMMQSVPVPLRVVPTSPAPDPCCAPGECPYTPSRIARLLRDLDTLAQMGYSPTEALTSFRSKAPTDREPPGFAPGNAGETAAGLVADLSRAFKAGKRDPMSISKFLCLIGFEEASR